mmetsp:Transcript_34822/g.81326  ORF Transcript_34822/g.81326 Transcript_34822/m.81326 type:complete len:110 (+) Transcript_34822:327-656(+)
MSWAVPTCGEVDLRTSESTLESDRQMIFEKVGALPGGFRAVNEAVKEALANHDMALTFQCNVEAVLEAQAVCKGPVVAVASATATARGKSQKRMGPAAVASMYDAMDLY